MSIKHPNHKEFKQILQQEEFVLVDFFGTWCGPCKMLSYVIDELDESFTDKIKIVKIDIDKEPELTKEYDITIVPTLVFIKQGKVLHKEIGFIPFEKISNIINNLFFNKKNIEIKKHNKNYDLIIIGAGAAGFTAAIYARRAGLKTLIIESFAPGGALVKTDEIQNWPGIPSIDGPSLAFSLYQHAMSLEPTYIYDKVLNVIDGEIKKVICESKNEFTAKALIIATGTEPRLMNIPGETDMIGRGISFCAVCDASFYKNKHVIVIGGGNSALEESLYLTKFAKEITIIIRRDVFRADKSVQKMVEQNKKINIIRNHIPKQILIENNKLIGLQIENTKTKQKQKILADGIFPYIGSDPLTSFVSDLGITNNQGYLLVNEKMETKLKGIYGAGDVCHKDLRQVVTATSDGAIAAQNVFHYIEMGQ